MLDGLYSTISRLEAIFPRRKFTPDGHLVGSIGEVIAAYMFDLDLLRGSNKGHDAIAQDGRKIEVKLTQGARVAIRHEPDHLIVLQRLKDGPVTVVFNGPGNVAWERCGNKGDNGQRSIPLSTLRALDRQIEQVDRLPLKREPPV
ncbi:hypothetical protein K9U39_14300 [Rhodoblastus acidophilus]|uniref:DUF6998 domain-containing protein n=1 Tax=Candidatus Rhodoblastus alkanivorans TaxID=2954117 RepID=A0ABS9ZAP8_9HYPH|nr:hypothetical protein [Candidatus Rhodoblastus alkanivorans]MCI4680027.1 hypothetical protein [Candidatus Rhodoblastus alkanivorans]MCI4684775.1 hypothetical protein [Candidatus Rhodoblastus alkanivorans]MDI4642098.1 hypothetical protein [Rhodoblastus acidophilus]